MDRAPPAPGLAVSERTLLVLLGAVQLVNVLDFMMVMPLGPDFAAALGFPQERIGLVGGSYVAAASVAGLAGAFFLDRFDRRTALGVTLAGLVLSTAAGGFATDLYTLVATRVAAGLFGGPSTALALAILSDVFPPERRGKALGAVMGAFSIASVFGVPVGLELARLGGWRLPFFAVAGVGAVVATLAVWRLPSLTLHLTAGRPPKPDFLGLALQPLVLLASAMTFLVMMGSFALIPNMSAYLQHNLGFPRAHLGYLYMAGGFVSFFATRFGGRLVDRFGAPPVATLGSLLLILVSWAGFYGAVTLPAIAIFIGFMMAMSLRGIPYNTAISKVPRPDQRASFMSLQSALNHAGAASGAMLGSRLLSSDPAGRLVGMPRLTLVSMALAATLPPLIFALEAALRRRGAAVAPAVTA